MEGPSFGRRPGGTRYPPEGAGLRSLRTWEVGHAAPLLAVEVVSETNPHKDPLLAGPASHGGPFRLQVWSRGADDTFTRVYAGDGPVRSDAVEGYLVAVDEGRKLRIADDAGATAFWLTAEEAERAAKEAERAAKEAERAAKEAERAAKEAALARVAALEAELAKRTAR